MSGEENRTQMNQKTVSRGRTAGKIVLYILLFLAILALDRWTKYLAATYLKGGADISVIGDAVYFTYLENRGMAFGFLEGQLPLFIGLTALILAAFLAYAIWKRPKSHLFYTSFVFIFGGALGNLFDRMFLSYVIDMIDVRIINFPVFNVADSFVVVGTILLCIYILRSGYHEETAK